MAAASPAAAAADMAPAATASRGLGIGAAALLRQGGGRRRPQADDRLAHPETKLSADHRRIPRLGADRACLGAPAIHRTATRKDRTAARPDAAARPVTVDGYEGFPCAGR